jgi:hypothetical protein
LQSHFNLVQQKDSLILNLRQKSREITASLAESKELVQTQQNQIRAVYKDLNYVRNLNTELISLIQDLKSQIKSTEVEKQMKKMDSTKACPSESLIIENWKIELDNLNKKLKEKDNTIKVGRGFYSEMCHCLFFKNQLPNTLQNISTLLNNITN